MPAVLTSLSGRGATTGTQARSRPSPVLAAPAVPQATRLRLTVPAEASSLGTVRQVVSALTRSLGFDATGVADARLALNEVVSPALARAIEDPDRPETTVEVVGLPGHLRVTVRTPRVTAVAPLSPVPLPLVAALTESMELRALPGGATETVLTFAAAGA